MLLADAVDLVSHSVKVQPNGGMRNVSQRHFNIFKLGPVEVGDLDGSINDAGDAPGLEEVPVGGHTASAQEERGGDLSNASYVSLGNHPRSHESPWERAVTSGAHEDAGSHTFVIRGQDQRMVESVLHRGIQDCSLLPARYRSLSELYMVFVYHSCLQCLGEGEVIF